MINDVELIKIILNPGVDVNIKNVNNTIPLHVALNRGAKSCVGFLLSAGENCNISGKTLCNYLEALPREWNLGDLMEVLREKGISLSPTVYEVGYWVKFKGSIVTPSYG